MPPASRGFWQQPSSVRPIVWTRTVQNVSGRKYVAPPLKIKLREYQEECITTVLAHLQQGKKRLGVSLATGAGKTVIFSQLIGRVPPITQRASQTLVLAHRQELVEQAARHCRNAYPTQSIDIEMGSLHASGFADITIASVQSITSGGRLSKFDPSRFKLVLVDEAHHIVAPGYLKTLAHFGLDKAHSQTPALVGVSATLSRFDGLKLGAALDHIVYHKDYVDMIGEKWLSPVIFTTVESKADLSNVKSGPAGDFRSSELSKAVNTARTNNLTVQTWLHKASQRKSTLVFCVDLAHVTSLTLAFRAHGIDARYVTGDTPRPERSATLDAFRAQRFPVLINCGVFTEGTDVPNIDCVLLARPTKSRNLLVQMIGRGMRLHPAKMNCHILDMVASLQVGIVTVPTLFGLDPSELIENATMEDLKSLHERKLEDARHSRELGPPDGLSVAADHSTRTLHFTDYDSVFDLIEDTTEERHIRAISSYAWVSVGDKRFILTTAGGKYLRLEYIVNGNEATYGVYEIVPLPAHFGAKAPFRPPREVATASTFQDAVHAADTFAANNYPRNFISRHQSWRSLPATASQLAFLNKLRLKDDQLTADSVSKGKAGDMITKLKHGARGRFAKFDAEKRKESRARSKLEDAERLKQREHVTIGPIQE